MNDFFPFIYNHKKENKFQQEQLYIEENPQILVNEDDTTKEDIDNNVIIIEIL